MHVAPLAGNPLAAEGAGIVLVEWLAEPGGEDPPLYIAPLHLHRSDDEAWYVLEGTLAFILGDERVEVPAGGGALPLRLVEPDWTVYCLGAGMDVSFETELIHRAGCEVHTFDPGDESAAYVAGLGEPALHFDQVAIWREDGTLRMYQSPVCWPASLSA